MDIQHLLDRLEALLNNSRRLPFSDSLLVDARRAWDLIDQMRISIPEEVRQAQRINQERERILAQAKEEAERIRQLAREKAAQLVEEHVITQEAKKRAREIRQQALQEAESIKADADDYVLEVLTQLEATLNHTLTVVRNGIARVQRERGVLTQSAQPQSAQPMEKPLELGAGLEDDEPD
ncbi:MAG: ATPase [Chloroflexi bacterium]|nr:MAG: ATPase [Chloroflexota bacterium]